MVKGNVPKDVQAEVKEEVKEAERSGSDQTSTILQAALDVLRIEGPAGLTVRKVAAAAGCSTTGVYTWFGGKTGLLDAILIDGFESFDAALAQVTMNPDTGPDPDWLVARGTEYRRWALDHRTEYLVMFTRSTPEHNPSQPALERGLESFESHIDSVRRVQAAGHLIGPEADALAHHLWASVHGYVMLELSGPQTDPTMPEHYEAGMRALLAGFSNSAA